MTFLHPTLTCECYYYILHPLGMARLSRREWKIHALHITTILMYDQQPAVELSLH
jgi:hypothetical protein